MPQSVLRITVYKEELFCLPLTSDASLVTDASLLLRGPEEGIRSEDTDQEHSGRTFLNIVFMNDLLHELQL